MRLFIVAALTAFGLGLAVTSTAYAAPIDATSIVKSASDISPLMTANSRRYYRRHYRWSYGPYYYDRPASDRPYYYGAYYHRPFSPFFRW